MHMYITAQIDLPLPVIFTLPLATSHGHPNQFKISIFIPVQ
jgi:hypothetical protein